MAMLNIIFLLLAVPSGFLIAWLARDELVQGRRWLTALIFLSFLLAILNVFYFKADYIFMASAFISVVSFISLIKSYDKKLTMKKFK